MQAPQLSVIVPTFNEAENVTRLLELLEASLLGIPYEVIFVDDDSPDGTAALVRRIASTNPKVRVLHRVGRKGLSSACMEGLMAANAPYLAVMDGDLQHDERILPEMLAKLQRENLDLVIGSRHVAGGGMGEFAKERVALSDMGRWLSEAVCRARVSDPMSGFFLLDRKFLNEVVYDISGIGFKILVDILSSAQRPLRLGEVGYTFRSRNAGESKLDTLVLVEFVQLLLDKLTGRIMPPRLLMFSLVGAAGLLVNLPLLYMLYSWGGMAFDTAFMTSSFVAMTINFFLNNLTTYRDCRLRGAPQIFWGLLSFWIFCLFGSLLALNVSNTLRNGGMHWALSSLIGVIGATFWNFFMTGMLTWRRLRWKRHQQPKSRALRLGDSRTVPIL